MIALTGNPGGKDCRIQFSPRPRFKTSHKLIERELVYGHYCPLCMNVVQALFLTDEPVDLWPYEATNVMSMGKSDAKLGTVLKVVPHAESKRGHTCYTSTVLPGSGDPGQHIVLKNHVLKYHGIENETNATDRFFEPGDRTCEYTGAFALRGDLLVRDICHFMRWEVAEMARYNLPSVEEFLTVAAAYDFRSLPAYGSAPPVVLFPRTKMTPQNKWDKGWGWQMRSIMKSFEKPKEKAAPAPF
jgi:hypothetical protein